MDLRELPGHAFTRHPWEIARADFFLRLLGDHLDAKGVRVLDVGAGDGYFGGRLSAELPTVANVTCFDPGYDPSWLATRRLGGRPMEFVTQAPAGSFDLVVLLDVLEHVDDDRALLDQAVTKTAQPGGWLLLSAPAHPLLFSHHDELLGHRRRYPTTGLRELAARAGLDIVCAGQLFASLLVPRALAVFGERWRGKQPAPREGHVETALTTWHHGAMVTSAVKSMLALDGVACRWAARWRLPLPGLSTWVLARRP